jgi:DNA-binding transcriptional LysR family regulator
VDRVTAAAVFVEIAERGSLTAAADALEMSRAMATRYLAELERWLGARVFHRTTRRLGLTAAGEQALVRCRRLLVLDAELRAIAGAGTAAAPQGRLRIACSTSFAQCQLAAAVAEYVAKHPGVSIDMVLADRAVNLVEERIDLAIRIASALDPNLIARKLSVCRSVLCASPRYLAARGVPQRAEDLARHNCLTHHFVGKSLWRLRRDGRESAVAVGGNISANEAGVLLEAVRADGGIATLPTYQVRPLLRSGELTAVLPDYDIEPMGLYAVYATRRQLPDLVRGFLDFLVARFGDEPAWDAA